jgi:hypothetical protein
MMAKIISKLITKVGKSLSSELILYLRKDVIELIKQNKGKELVEVFFVHATKQDRSGVLAYIIDNVY